MAAVETVEAGVFTEHELVRGRVQHLALMISRMIRELTHTHIHAYTNGQPPQSRPISAQFMPDKFTINFLFTVFALLLPFIDLRAATARTSHISVSGACTSLERARRSVEGYQSRLCANGPHFALIFICGQRNERVRLPLLIRTGNPVGLKGCKRAGDSGQKFFGQQRGRLCFPSHRRGGYYLMSETFSLTACSASEVRMLIFPITYF